MQFAGNLRRTVNVGIPGIRQVSLPLVQMLYGHYLAGEDYLVYLGRHLVLEAFQRRNDTQRGDGQIKVVTSRSTR